MEKQGIVKLQYFIGVDSNDEEVQTYCLMKKLGNTSEIMLMGTKKDKIEFEQEVNNLAKCFNATRLKGIWEHIK